MAKKWDTLVLRDALSPNVRMLQALGYWPPEDATPAAARSYRACSIVLLGLTYFLYMLSEVVNILQNINDLEEITKACFLFITHVSQLVKLYYFVTKNKRIVALANSLQAKDLRAHDPRHHQILARAIRTAQTIFYVFIAMGVFTCALWGIFPFLQRADDGSISLPLSGYYPFSTERSPTFELVFAYQIGATLLNGLANISMDTAMAAFMCIICAELDVLNDSLANVRGFAVRRLGARAEELHLAQDRADDHERTHPELDAEMNAVLVDCVHRHWKILQAIDDISELFNICALSQLVAGTLLVCLTMFMLTLVELFSLQFFSMVMYQFCMLVELILWCWFGNEIILKSENICYSIYSSDWYRNSHSYKQNILMIMTRSQVPISLSAGNLFTLSLVTFAAILRSSWSYFAVLRRVHDAE